MLSMQISIIIPCYNECSRLPVDAFKSAIVKYPNANFCFVNDGSSDQTGQLLEDFALSFPSTVHVLHLSKNSGKAEAVRLGMTLMLSKGLSAYLCYLDADLSTPIVEVERLFDIMVSKSDLQLTFGSRVSVFGSQITRLSYRHYGGRLIATLIDMVLRLSIYDTQCGLKIFHHTLAKKIFIDAFLTRWLFDVEIFARIKMIYPTKDLNLVMKEIPLNEWEERGGSKIRVKDILALPLNLLSIKMKYSNNVNSQLQIGSQILTN